MANARNLKAVNAAVANILLINSEARNNDFILYKKVCEQFEPEFMNKPFSQVMDKAMFSNMPIFESVRRARQKLQHDAPLLYGSHENCRKARANKQKEYREFARG